MQMNVKYFIHGYKYENIVYIPVELTRYSWKYSTFIKCLLAMKIYAMCVTAG